MSGETNRNHRLPTTPEQPAPSGAEPRPASPPPFRRLPNESARAWEGFCIYVELGATRSLRRVAERLNKSETVVAEWSGRYDWVNRATLVDEAVARARHEAVVRAEAEDARRRVKRLRALNNSNFDLGHRLRQRARQMLDWPIEETVSDETTVTEDGQIVTRTVVKRPVKWTFRDMMTAAELSDRLMKLGLGVTEGGRPVTGMGDLNLTVNIGGQGLTLEQRVQLARRHLQQTLLPDRERYIDRLASAEPERPRRELEEYVDRMLVQWTAEDWKVPEAALTAGEEDGDPLLHAINVTPEKDG